MEAGVSQLQRVRDAIMEGDGKARVAREVWACRGHTYEAYRAHLCARAADAADDGASDLTAPPGDQRVRSLRTPARSESGGSGSGGGGWSHANEQHHGGAGASGGGGAQLRMAAPPQYAFGGVRFISSDSAYPVTALSFAKLQADLLAYGNSDGELWIVKLPGSDGGGGADGSGGGSGGDSAAAKAASERVGEAERMKKYDPVVIKTETAHGKAILGLDWSYENSQLLSVGADGALCMWDVSTGACLRSLATGSQLLCIRTHRLNPNMVMVGNKAGRLEVYNCSSGTLAQKVSIAGTFGSASITAVEASNHHVFFGDSDGSVHMYKCEIPGGQLTRLTRASRLRVARGALGVSALEYAPFCATSDSPLLFVACCDGTLALLKVVEKQHRLELLRWCMAPLEPTCTPGGKAQRAQHESTLDGESTPGEYTPEGAHMLRAVLCPLSTITKLPNVCMGAPDSKVHILDISAKPRWGKVPRPAVVATLRGHRAPIAEIAISYDESLLASGDISGTVIVWERAES